MTERRVLLFRVFCFLFSLSSEFALAFSPKSLAANSPATPLFENQDRNAFRMYHGRTKVQAQMNDNSRKDIINSNMETNTVFSTATRRSFFISTALLGLTNVGSAGAASPSFQRIRTQFIAALGDPTSTSGTNVNEWGLWTVDPGPRGVFLKDYNKDLAKRGNKAPAGWAFDEKDWWLEEHGLIMEPPAFPLDPGKYVVTGGRDVTTVLTVGESGNTWSLEKGTLYDVTHLPCRSARYVPNRGGGSPLTANQRDFPVKPGAEMPAVEGCDKLDYAVLFVIGKEVL